VLEDLIEDQPRTIADGRSVARWLESGILAGLLLLLTFAPLALGAVEDWAVFCLRMGSATVLALWLALALARREFVLGGRLSLACIAAFLLVAVFQSVLKLSAYPAETRSATLNFAAYATLFFIAGQICQGRRACRILVLWACVFGSGTALLALLQHFSSPGAIYWRIAPERAWVFGPYINHNHYAGLMELLTPFPVVLASRRFLPVGSRLLCGFGALLMAGSIVISGSRGGMFALVCELAVLALLMWKRVGRRELAAALAMLIVLGTFVWWAGSDATFARLATLRNAAEPSVDGRMQVTRDALHMWRQRPLLGWGLGTFPIVYPRYRTFYSEFLMNEAHNDVVQLLTETGLVGFAVAITFFVAALRRGVFRLREGRSTYVHSARAAAITAVVGILVHSFFDFNLHIPANAALFAVIIAIGALPAPAAQPEYLTSEIYDPVPSRPRHRHV
jgi:O-antigen ligase